MSGVKRTGWEPPKFRATLVLTPLALCGDSLMAYCLSPLSVRRSREKRRTSVSECLRTTQCATLIGCTSGMMNFSRCSTDSPSLTFTSLQDPGWCVDSRVSVPRQVVDCDSCEILVNSLGPSARVGGRTLLVAVLRCLFCDV